MGKTIVSRPAVSNLAGISAISRYRAAAATRENDKMGQSIERLAAWGEGCLAILASDSSLEEEVAGTSSIQRSKYARGR